MTGAETPNAHGSPNDTMISVSDEAKWALHMDRLDDVAETRFDDPVVGPLALRLDGLDGFKDVVLHAGT